MFARHTTILFLGLVAITSLVGCESSPTFPPFDDPSTFFYDYQGLGDGGGVVVQGILALQYDSPISFTGVWKFDPVASDDALGPQIGHGTVKGQVTRGEIRIVLQPGVDGRHVELVGNVLGRDIDGAWRWVGPSGPLNQGKFKATPRSMPPQ